MNIGDTVGTGGGGDIEAAEEKSSLPAPAQPDGPPLSINQANMPPIPSTGNLPETIDPHMGTQPPLGPPPIGGPMMPPPFKEDSANPIQGPVPPNMPPMGFPFAPMGIPPPPVGGEDPQMVAGGVPQPPVDVVPPQLTPEITQMLLSGGPTPHMVTVGPTGKDEVICGSTDRRTQTRKRIERLESLNSVPRNELSAKDKEAKLRLLKLESNRRAAQVSRQKKKRYIKNLEDRARVMAKHLAELEIENNQLRSLLGEMIVTRGPPGGGAIEIPVQSAPIKLPPFPDPNELGPEMAEFTAEQIMGMGFGVGDVPHPPAIPGSLQPLKEEYGGFIPPAPPMGLPPRTQCSPIPEAAPKPSRSGRRKVKRKLQSCYA